jgi:hypothetical protein
MAAGPSFFVDITNATYHTATPVVMYAVKSVSISRRPTIIYGMDNTKQRPIASHTTTVQDTVEVELEDLASYNALLGTAAAPADFTFTGKAATSQPLVTLPLADQLVTLKSVVWNDRAHQAPARSMHSFRLSGTLMQQADASDPIVIAAAP